MPHMHLFCQDLITATCCTLVLQSTLTSAFKLSLVLPPEWLQVAHGSSPLMAMSVTYYTGYRQQRIDLKVATLAFKALQNCLSI